MSLSVGDYPADASWVLYFEFRAEAAEGAAITFNSTADGTKHFVSVAKDTTAVWAPGFYKGQAYVDNGTQRFLVWQGRWEVKADYSYQTGTYDTRSNAQKCLDAIDAVLLGKASRDVLNFTIAGQTVARMTFTELIRAKDYYKSVVNEELADLGILDGKTGSNLIKARFSRAS